MPTKKTTTKKVAKKSTAKRAPSKKAKVPTYETLKLTRQDVPFFKPRVTMQTFYWSVIAIAVLMLGLWTISLKLTVDELYRELEATKSGVYSAPKDKIGY